ncbi:MAG: hypothetical protein QOK42_1220 [Frankiaceae bacterium]|nr:hypothetical protein [Frankiaceae bacterium]
MPRVMVVYGTRPEAVKLAPLVLALRDAPGLEPRVVVTAQHRSMLDEVNEVFGIEPDHDLDLMTPGQSLADLTTRAVLGLSPLLEAERPDAVVVQGDTTTTFAAALAAFYNRIPVVHVEAGLRTHDRYSPYPEEVNRRLTTALSTLHLAPTPHTRGNLVAEGIAAGDIAVTGNTVIDALHWVLAGEEPPSGEEKVLLVTAHRRESWGQGMASIGRAVARIAAAQPSLKVVLPAHRNPVVRETLLPELHGLANVEVCEPLSYRPFARLLARSTLVLTDSGGLQEEAPALGKPVLVMRDTTERPEGVEAGTVKVIGTDEDRIVSETLALLTDAAAYDVMAKATNPYGDGAAAARSVAAISQLLGIGPRLPDFVP